MHQGTFTIKLAVLVLKWCVCFAKKTKEETAHLFSLVYLCALFLFCGDGCIQLSSRLVCDTLLTHLLVHLDFRTTNPRLARVSGKGSKGRLDTYISSFLTLAFVQYQHTEVYFLVLILDIKLITDIANQIRTRIQTKSIHRALDHIGMQYIEINHSGVALLMCFF